MSKRKSTQTDRTKRAPRDPAPEREGAWRPSDDEGETDGTVDGEMELDTERYERPDSKSNKSSKKT